MLVNKRNSERTLHIQSIICPVGRQFAQKLLYGLHALFKYLHITKLKTNIFWKIIVLPVGLTIGFHSNSFVVRQFKFKCNSMCLSVKCIKFKVSVLSQYKMKDVQTQVSIQLM